MAGFEIIEHPLRTIWMPVGYVGAATPKTLYVGQLVTSTLASVSSGAMEFVQSGTPDTRQPFGVVVATNNATPVFDTTYKAEYITSVNTQATELARDWRGVEGMTAKGDPQAMVQVAVIGGDTILKGRIFRAAYGTALSTGIVTTGSSDGLSYTCSAGLGLTRIAYNSTHYCRSGANMGLYRISYDTDTTGNATTLYNPFPYDISAGDVMVACNVAVGITNLTFDSLGTYVNGQAAQTATQVVQVLELNLRDSGSEYVIFRFNPRLI
jgi:hypothetical protein